MGRASLMLVLGAVIARLLRSGGFGMFVQQHMQYPLMAAAVVLLIFGGYEAIAGVREERRDAASVKRSTGPTIGWLLMLPLLVLVAVAPTALGAAAADRVDAYTPTQTNSSYSPLDTSKGPVEMRVFEFLDRALWDDTRTLEGAAVRLEGLVVNDPDVPDGFKLTRFMVSCCAADGIPLQVSVHAPSVALPDDTWVVADIVWRPPDQPYHSPGGPSSVEADAVSVVEVPDAPNDPYESPY